MEGINKTLYDELVCAKYSYDIKHNIKIFLTLEADDYKRRQELALDIAADILEVHMKEDLPYLAVQLAQLERTLTEIQPHQRDHICHAIFTYLLGHYMIDKLNLEKKFYDFLFQWKISSLLHDVGYSLEIIDRLDNDFFYYYERNVLDEEFTEVHSRSNQLIKYLDLYTTLQSQKRNSLNIFTNRLKEWKIEVDTEEIFDKICNGIKFDSDIARTDHGVVSSILVMKAIDKKYSIRNPLQSRNRNNPWNYCNLENQITNACASIFVRARARC